MRAASVLGEESQAVRSFSVPVGVCMCAVCVYVVLGVREVWLCAEWEGRVCGCARSV